MSQDILATEVSLARDEIMTETQLNQLIRTGPKRKLKKAVEATETVQLREAIPASVEAVTAPPEEPHDPWQRFDPQMKQLIGHIQGLKESHVLPKDMMNLIALAENAQTIEDFAMYSETQLIEFIETIRNRLPKVNQEMRDFMAKVNQSRTITVQSDFI